MTDFSRLDRLLDHFLTAGVPGCGLAVSYQGEIVYTGYRGCACIADKKPVDKHTLYQLASATKMVVITGFMMLYEEGLVLLNDPLERYLPFFKNAHYQVYDPSGEIVVRPVSRPITIKDCILQIGGIPYAGKGSPTAADYHTRYGGFFDGSMSLMELAKSISEIPLEFDPGTHWHYGQGYEVLGAVMEVITGKTLGAYLKDALLDPLGMTNTSYMLTKDKADDLAHIYKPENGQLVDVTVEPAITETNGGRLEGSLISTVEDLVKLTGMWSQGGIWEGTRYLSRNTIDLMRKNYLKGQPLEDFKLMTEQAYPWYKGYGWSLAGRTMMDCQEAGSNGSVGEFGWCGAYGPYLLGDPKKGIGVAYAHQMFPVLSGMQDYCHPRVRNAVYSLLGD